MKKFIIIFLPIFFVSTILICFSSQIHALELPPAQRQEAEKYFLKAYTAFLSRDYWGSCDYLNQALDLNTYMVDYYLLKALNLQSIGQLDEAKRTLRYYMEVRPNDSSAQRLLGDLTTEKDYINTCLFKNIDSSFQWEILQKKLKQTANTSLFKPINIQGLGKGVISNGLWALPDQIGDILWFFSPETGSVISSPVKEPASAVFMNERILLVMGRRGEVYRLSLSDNATAPQVEELGALSCTVSDIVWQSDSEFIVANISGRNLLFVSYPDLQIKNTWVPESTKKPFEPSALASYGPWIAIADRNNDTVFLLNKVTREIKNICISQPRDIEWGIDGSLFIVSDKGSLMQVKNCFSQNESKTSILSVDMSGCWSLLRDRDIIWGVDTRGLYLWEIWPLPDPTLSQGFFFAYEPTLQRNNDGSDYLRLKGAFSAPYYAYSNQNPFIASAVWGGQNMKPTVSLLPSIQYSQIAFIEITAEKAVPLIERIRQIWERQKETLRHIVLSEASILEPEELASLVSFCIHNGIALSFSVSDGGACMWMELAAALTGGTVAPTPELAAASQVKNKILSIEMSLPAVKGVSGYSEQSMLSLYIDLGLLQMRNWLPLWPEIVGTY